MTAEKFLFGTEKHIQAFNSLVDKRKKIFHDAPETPIAKNPNINKLSTLLHPKSQHFVITEKVQGTKKMFVYTLKPKDRSVKPAFFQAGQYLSVKLNIDGHPVTRPYSIASSPMDALSGFYKLAVQKAQGAFVSDYIHKNWIVGTEIETSGPQGNFYYNRLRDASTVIGIAGGCGVTPFTSMARDIVGGRQYYNLILLYGCRKEEDILFHKEFKELEKRSMGKFKFSIVLSEEQKHGYYSGFITAELIQKFSNDPFSVFLCGPKAMYDFLENELNKIEMIKKNVRRELYGQITNIFHFQDYPQKKQKISYKITLCSQNKIWELPASSNESLLVALERAKISVNSCCRSGECGFCRARLLSGEVYVPPHHNHGLRQADAANGIIHLCSSYPLGDVKLELM